MADAQLGIALRPTKFEDVIGQEDTVKVLQAQIDKNEIPRAMMFVGPAGTGKTTLAKIISRAVQGWDFPADREPDFIEINAADVTGIDDMRELVEKTDSYPMQGKFRVIILDEAHKLTVPAQNCLLKPFEQANSATVWIICTTETGKIIKPLQTRCQIFNLKRLDKRGIHTLVVKAAEYTGCTDYAAFETAAIQMKLDQPRPLLNAFGNFVNGMPAEEAVNGQVQTYGASPFELAMSVAYGLWDKDTSFQAGPKTVTRTACVTLLKNLESEFKKAKKASASADASEDELEINDEDDALSRPEFSRSVRYILGATLKNMILKGKNADLAAQSLDFLTKAISPNEFDVPLEYPATIAALYRINKKLTGGK